MDELTKDEQAYFDKQGEMELEEEAKEEEQQTDIEEAIEEKPAEEEAPKEEEPVEEEEPKEEVEEEEYEEITIPSEAELNSMTKADILKSAEELGFENVNVADTKKVMIQNFVADSNAFIQSLEDSGDLVSANIESDEDGDTDRQDGGYF